MSKSKSQKSSSNRRSFLKAGGLMTAAALGSMTVPGPVARIADYRTSTAGTTLEVYDDGSAVDRGA